MNSNNFTPLEREFRPTARYLAFLWLGVAFVHAGLVFISRNPWLNRETQDAGSRLVWVLFDIVLLAGCLQATLFRVRVDEAGMEYVAWHFHRVRWEWDEVTRMERITFALVAGMLGARYRVMAGRRGFGFTAVTLAGARELARTIVERADLDDMGERDISLQEGTRHIWLHPSAQED